MKFELIGSSNLNNEIKSNVCVNTKRRLLSYIKIIALDPALLHCLADGTESQCSNPTPTTGQDIL